MYLTTIYSWLMDGLDSEQRSKVDELLFEIPATAPARVIEAAPEWQTEAVGNQFMAQMAMRGGQGRAATGASLAVTPVTK